VDENICVIEARWRLCGNTGIEVVEARQAAFAIEHKAGLSGAGIDNYQSLLMNEKSSK
jgi:hypothetical protein